MPNDADLQRAIELVNNWPTRPCLVSPLLKIATCDFCGAAFPVQSQDYSLMEQRGFTSCCGALGCRTRLRAQHNEKQRARRLAQRGGARAL